MKRIVSSLALLSLLACSGCIIHERRGGAYDRGYHGRGYDHGNYRYDHERDYYRGDAYPDRPGFRLQVN